MKSARLALACIVLALAACTREGIHALPDDARTKTLRTASTIEIPGFNPMVHDNAYVIYYAPLIFDFLLSADARGNLIPDLATAVPSRANGGVSADGRTITYHLRPGVKWHDGAAFDARDVVFSYSAVMNRENAVPDRTGYDQVVDVRARDPLTVVVRLKRAFTPFLPSFFTLGANDPYPIVPAHLLAHETSLNHAAFDSHPIGTGPFRLARWERGSRMLFTANPHYWAGAPRLAHIDVQIVTDSNTLANIYKTGGIDMRELRVTNGTDFYNALAHAPDTHVAGTPHYEFDYYMFNQSRPPFDDVNVRRAVIAAFDRTTAMRELEGPLALPADTDRLPGTFAFDPTLHQPVYDPVAAARILDADGWRLGADGTRRKDGRPLEVQVVGTAESKMDSRLDLLLQQQLLRVGIRAAIKPYAYDQLWAPRAEHGIFAEGRFDMAFSGWQPNAVNDHSYLFRCDTQPPNGDNFGRICDPEIDAAARAELAATDPRAEAAADRALTARLVEQSDILFLGFNREAIAYRDGLTGFAPQIMGTHTWNVRQWGWSH